MCKGVPMRRPAVWLALLMLLGGNATAFAHGMVGGATTPLFPPGVFIWLLPCYGVIFIALNMHLLRRAGARRFGACLGATWTFLIFWLVCLAIGVAVRLVGFGLVPGFGVPGERAFLGAGWTLWPVFIFWNLVAILVLRRVLLWELRGDLPEERQRRACVRLNTAAYLAALVPFLVTGAMMQGWTGGHVTIACQANLREMGAALAVYAREHKGGLPEGNSFEAVRDAVQRAYSKAYPQAGPLPTVCPMGRIYERNPRSYEWSPAFAGASSAALKQRHDLEWVIRCPYHEGVSLTVGELLRLAGDPALDGGVQAPEKPPLVPDGPALSG